MLEQMAKTNTGKRVIHKFNANSEFIELGLPAKFLAANMQNDDIPKVWIEHSPNSEIKAKVELKILATGNTVPQDFNYLGTFFEDVYVWHVYAKAIKQ